MQNGAESAGASSLKNIIPDVASPVQKTFSQTVKMTVLVLTPKKKSLSNRVLHGEHITSTERLDAIKICTTVINEIFV
ncbi:hypothetical protein ZW61_001012 [Salmonella enterica subsp. houtenae]|uniref:Uncharacterized protein n=2 Tax=Salmonella houtenae TaxID=59205 RepID=A0A5Y6M6M6_SALHO|nr:hypothetical protein [Salmonella enterica]EAW2232054.1 hypothetical protein [Salmonella enterica subsp. enterica]EBF8286193.1 hypothetical protein [Salmonella enterica subsp. houtenae]ECU3287469.1 hypothetical protein [Salmonella enterica subsp. houtenae serovar Houten]EDS4965884.1 hypothetical protein [Salmonella enterica subsp. enterica serovar O rough]